MGLCRDEMTMSGICFKTKKREKEKAQRHDLQAFSEAVGTNRILPIIHILRVILVPLTECLCLSPGNI